MIPAETCYDLPGLLRGGASHSDSGRTKRSVNPSRQSLRVLSIAVILLSQQIASQTHPSSSRDASQTATSNTKRKQSAKRPASFASQATPEQTSNHGAQSQTQGYNDPQKKQIQESPSAVPASPILTEPSESFSQLTLFLFGSGLALFVALLGWSDQIRGIDKDTKELESRFLEDTGINKRDFVCIVKSDSPDQQLEALTQVAVRLKTRVGVDLLRTFKQWNSEWSRLEGLSVWKYNLTVTLTVALFVAGITSLFTTPNEKVSLYFITIRVEVLVLMLPMILIGLLLCIIIHSAQREKALRTLLNSISDMV